MQSVIGALRAILGLETAAFEKGSQAATKELNKLVRNFQSSARQLESIGRTMSVGITAPIAAMGGLTLRAAGNFEEGMNKVRAATGATAAEMAELSKQAKTIGRDTGFGATEAASAMEALAKNGLNVREILDGAAEATVKLAAANGAQLAPSADIVTDTMQNFGKTTKDLGDVVNQVTGTLIASKFSFDDYRLAIGQAAGVAGKVGISFEDFNAGLAATSSSFASGSDAGTSFKTFLTKLVPTSEEAAGVMKQLNLEFFDAKGAMLPLDEIAQRLQKSLGGLSDRARTQAVTKMFGTDAMRTALSLMEKGAEGVRRMRAEIGKASAADQAAVRIEGLNGALRRLRSAVESLMIAIGESGLLAWATDLASRLTDLTNRVAELPPEVLRLATVVAGAAAILGPMVLTMGLLTRGMAMFGKVVASSIPALAGVVAAVLPWVRVATLIGTVAASVLLFGDDIKVATGSVVSLSDVVKTLSQEMQRLGGLIASVDFLGWLRDIPGVARELDRIAAAFAAVGDTRAFLESTAREFDLIRNSIAAVGAAAGEIMAAFDNLRPWLRNLVRELGNILLGGLVNVLNQAIAGVNEKFKQIGKSIPPVDFKPWELESVESAAQSGARVAEAWNKAFGGRFFSDWLQRLMSQTMQNATTRLINQMVPAPDYPGTPPPGAKPAAPAGGGGGGGLNTNFGGGAGGDKKSATDKLKEYIDQLQRSVELEKLANKERAIAEALDRARTIALQGKIQLTQADIDTITRYAAAEHEAKRAGEERQRLEGLAKTTIEESRTAQERYNVALRDLNELLRLGLINQAQFQAASKKLNEELVKNSDGLANQLDQISSAITDAARDVSQVFTKTEGDMGQALLNIAKRFGEMAAQILIWEPLFKAMSQTMKDLFTGGGSGGSGGGGLGGIFGSILSAIAGAFSGGGGGAGNVAGLVGTGSLYGEGGKIPAGRSGIVGDEGAEIVSGPATVFSHAESQRMAAAWYAGTTAGAGRGRAGMRQSDIADGGQTVVNNMHFAVGVRGEVRAELMAMMPTIADAGARRAQAYRQRGGSYKKAFR